MEVEPFYVNKFTLFTCIHFGPRVYFVHFSNFECSLGGNKVFVHKDVKCFLRNFFSQWTATSFGEAWLSCLSTNGFYSSNYGCTQRWGTSYLWTPIGKKTLDSLYVMWPSTGNLRWGTIVIFKESTRILCNPENMHTFQSPKMI